MYIATSQITVEQLVYTIIYNTLSNYLVVCITNSDSFDRQARCTDLVRRFAASHGAAWGTTRQKSFWDPLGTICQMLTTSFSFFSLKNLFDLRDNNYLHDNLICGTNNIYMIYMIEYVWICKASASMLIINAKGKALGGKRVSLNAPFHCEVSWRGRSDNCRRVAATSSVTPEWWALNIP